MISANELNRKANTEYPDKDQALMREAYIRGYMEAVEDENKVPDSFFTEIAEGLRSLWPPGEKEGRYPWRDSVTNISKRLKFVWRQHRFRTKYTKDDCLAAARRYLAQFEDGNIKYMQTLKYFVFKQEKNQDLNGKFSCTYKSTLADYLEDSITSLSQEMPETLFDDIDTSFGGEII